MLKGITKLITHGKTNTLGVSYDIPRKETKCYTLHQLRVIDKSVVFIASYMKAKEAEAQESEKDSSLWVEEHGDYLFRIAYTQVRDRDLAQDLIQDTFVSAIRALDTFEGRSSIRSWLRSILRNKIIDHHRKANRTEALPTEDVSFYDSSDHFNKGIWRRLISNWGQSPEDLVTGKDFYQVLEKCLTKLPERHRQIFTLRTLEGLEREDICKELDISASNFWVIMHRARLGLRKCIEKNWVNT